MTFWKWWTINILVIVGLVVSEYTLEALTMTVKNDTSYLTIVIFIIYWIAAIQIGVKSYKLQFKDEGYTDDDINMQWYLSDLVMSIGMVGTLVGFIMVLGSAFAEVDPSDTEAMKGVIASVATGMGVAILTTLVGLIASIFLKFELVILERDNAKTL